MIRRVVWPLALAQTVMWAGSYYLFPALLLHWERELGWSKAELTVAFTSALILSALLAPLTGRLIDHGKSRFILAGSAMLCSFLLLLLSQVTSWWQFFLCWLGIGIAMSGGLYEACFSVLTRVMGAQAKRAITLVSLVAGFAGTLSFPLNHFLANTFGWRSAVLCFAALILFMVTPLAWYACRLGEQNPLEEFAVASGRSRDALKTLRTATFWYLATAFAMVSLDHGMMLTHLLPLLDERQSASGSAVLAASMLGPMQVAGRLAMMAAERHVSNLFVGGACFVALSLAAISLLGAMAIPVLLVLFVVLQGAGNGVTSIVRPILVAELLGRRNFGVVSGLLAIPYIAGYATGPTFGSAIWQWGGYQLMLIVACGISLFGLLMLILAAKTAKPVSALAQESSGD